jgi:hypothetical protein
VCNQRVAQAAASSDDEKGTQQRGQHDALIAVYVTVSTTVAVWLTGVGHGVQAASSSDDEKGTLNSGGST